MLAAMRDVGRGPADSARNVAIEFLGPIAPLPSSVLNEAWQGDLFLTVGRNRLLANAVNSSSLNPACPPPGATISAAANGVLLHSCLEAGSVAATALLQAAATALVQRSFTEQEPSIVLDDVLRSWERPATVSAPQGQDETSPDGRWFWLLAIALLVLEQIVRRGHVVGRATPVTAMREDRVA
jgi:hypothetical protein